jgi:adenylate cyclase
MSVSANRSGFLRKPAVMGAFLGLVLFAAILAMRSAGLLVPAELEAHDLFLRMHQGAAAIEPRVVLVSVNEADIQQLGQWPLPDDRLAKLIEELQTHKPRAIGIDIYRDLPVPPGTGRLEQLLAASRNIVMVDKFGGAGSPGVAPPAILRGTDQVGFSDILVDRDGVVRRGLLFLDDGVDVAYSLSLRLALQYLQSQGIQPRPGESDPSHLRLGDVTLPPFEANDGGYVGADAAGYQFMLDYRGGPNPFPVYTLGELLGGDIPPGALAGQLVIVGVAADSVKDNFLTPYRHAGDLPGLPGSVLHAHATSQLLRAALDGERQLAVLDDATEYLWILVWTATGVLLVLRFKPVWRLLVAALFGTCLLVLLAYLAYAGGNLWLPVVPAAIGWVASAALMTAYLTSHENALRRQLMELFSRQVSGDVAAQIWERRDDFLAGGRLRARRVTATVLFSDLEGFTAVAERLGPTELLDWLNDYMETMAGLVLEHGGIIDDYYGDAIMADFGVPLARGSEEAFTLDARNAVDCALAMREAVSRLNMENQRRSLPAVRMRVGIATGEMMAGFLGTSRRMKYTTIGDTVNTAARLESYAKELPPAGADEGDCRILIAASTARRLDGRYRTEPVGRLVLKGKSEPVAVFRLLAKAD